MTDEEVSTTAEVVREQTLASAKPEVIEVAPGIKKVIGSDRLTVLAELDDEQYGPAPRRARGTVKVHSADSFIQAARQRGGEPVLYADEENRTLVAILNDDAVDAAGWRDHRVELSSRPTPEWQHWNQHQGLKEQSMFADVIDKGRQDIVEPEPAVMLELAQTFQATVGARFQQQGKLQNGQRQFTYTEEVAGQAGENGTLEVPEQFAIGLAPFFGSRSYRVDADLRWQVRGGDFKIGYFLVRPDDVLLAAFTDIKDAVATGLGVTPIAGVAPSAVS